MEHLHDHDRGLAFDLATLDRRRALKLLGGGALAMLVGCGSDSDEAASTSSSSSSTAATAAAGDCTTIPEETAGPYPGDGSNGLVRFTSIFPAGYSGRWPHIHFEVYESLAATGGGTRFSTSQVALPEDACNAVYATSGYERSVTNFAQTPLDGDDVFGDDGGESQLATAAGSADSGYTVTLRVPVDSTAVSSPSEAPGTDGAPAGSPPGADD